MNAQAIFYKRRPSRALCNLLVKWFISRLLLSCDESNAVSINYFYYFFIQINMSLRTIEYKIKMFISNFSQHAYMSIIAVKSSMFVLKNQKISPVNFIQIGWVI